MNGTFAAMGIASVMHRFGETLPVRIERSQQEAVDVPLAVLVPAMVEVPFSDGSSIRPDPVLYVRKQELGAYVPEQRDRVVTSDSGSYLITSVEPMVGDRYELSLRPLA